MAQIIRGTTPTIEYTFRVVSVADIATAILTIKQSGEVLIQKDLSKAEVGESSLSWKLSQAECLQLSFGGATIMLNWLLADGTRGASNETPVAMVQNHIPEVIT